MSDEQTVLPRTDLTVGDARRKLAGWHFAQESMTKGERSVLYVAEGLLRLLDEIAAVSPADTMEGTG